MANSKLLELIKRVKDSEEISPREKELLDNLNTLLEGLSTDELSDDAEQSKSRSLISLENTENRNKRSKYTLQDLRSFAQIVMMVMLITLLVNALMIAITAKLIGVVGFELMLYASFSILSTVAGMLFRAVFKKNKGK